MEEWKERVDEEQGQLGVRIIKLDAFIKGTAFTQLPPVQQGLLRAQKHVMEAYYDILNDRLRFS